MLNDKMIELKSKLVEFGVLVESMIGKSMKGLLDKDEALLKEVIEKDEALANHYDNEIDELCVEIIAQFEPMASDLRRVIMNIKMNKDFERMADHVVNIAESSEFLIARPPFKSFQDTVVMAERASAMLKDSIKAFVDGDVVLARNVLSRDENVDVVADKIKDDLISLMHDAHDGIKRSFHILRIAQNLERIADLSTNICEEVIYIVEGKDIRHSH